MNDINIKQPEILSVGLLTKRMKTVMEQTFSDVFVVGEISNLSFPKSGHCYFTLKDQDAQLSCIVWKTAMTKLRFALANGLEIICRGKIEIYPPYGKYQLIVSRIEPKGIGALELAYKQLESKLNAEGLFDASRKRPLPKRLKKIAVITSKTGAAIRDFLNIMYRHSRRICALIVPVQVQGSGASLEIANAFRQLNALSSQDRPDVIALIRGGGSNEDLWTFNEEPTVRAVAASKIPVITGIGHEVDQSLCDLAADFRALTPSDAAARLIPDDSELFLALNLYRSHLDRLLQQNLDRSEERLNRVKRSALFTDPQKVLTDFRTREVHEVSENIQNAMKRCLDQKENRVSHLAARLNALSPLAVLGRGYSLTCTPNGTVLRKASETAPGEKIITRLEEGSIECRVEKIL